MNAPCSRRMRPCANEPFTCILFSFSYFCLFRFGIKVVIAIGTTFLQKSHDSSCCRIICRFPRLHKILTQFASILNVHILYTYLLFYYKLLLTIILTIAPNNFTRCRLTNQKSNKKKRKTENGKICDSPV